MKPFPTKLFRFIFLLTFISVPQTAQQEMPRWQKKYCHPTGLMANERGHRAPTGMQILAEQSKDLMENLLTNPFSFQQLQHFYA
jgi:hypothetical protein